MALPRPQAWALAGLLLVIAFAFALAGSAGGMFLVATILLEGVDDVDLQSLCVASVLLIGGFIAVVLLVTLSVAAVFGKPCLSPWYSWRRRHPLSRVRIRTLMAVVAAFAAFLALGVFADRAFHAYRTARSHAYSAQAYRWLRGLDSEFAVFGFLRFPGSDVWTPEELEYLRAIERYHQGLTQKYDSAACHPWLSVPTDPAEPHMPAEEPWTPLKTMPQIVNDLSGTQG